MSVSRIDLATLSVCRLPLTGPTSLLVCDGHDLIEQSRFFRAAEETQALLKDRGLGQRGRRFRFAIMRQPGNGAVDEFLD